MITITGIVELAVNDYVTVYALKREAVPRLISDYGAIPNLVVEFNDTRFIRHVVFAYVVVNYPADVSVDYTGLINDIADSIALAWDPRINLGHVKRSEYVARLVSTLGTPNSLNTAIRGLYALAVEPQEQLDLHEPASHTYLTVFNRETLHELIGLDPWISGLTYASVEIKDRRILVTHHADTHGTDSEVAPS